MHAVIVHPSARAARDLAQPLPVVTAWGSEGTRAFVVFAASIAAGSIGYVAALRCRSTALIIAASIAALAAALSWPVVFSSDVYAYAVYGERAAAGIDPYLPRRLGADPVERAAAAQWGDPPPRAVYGPAFLAIAAALAPLRFFGVRFELTALRVAACTALVFATFTLGRMRGARTAATLGLNPLVVWTVAEGHSDAFALAALLAAATASTRRATNGWLIAAMWIKATAFPPALALAAAGPRGLARIAIGLIGVAGYALLIRSLVRAPPQPSLTASMSASAFSTFASLAGGLPPWLAALTATVATVLLVALAAAPALSARQGPRRGVWAGCALALWFAAPSVEPWYAVWLAAAAAVDFGSPAATAALVGTILATLRYLVDASLPASAPIAAWIGVGMFLVPAATLLALNRKLR